MHYTAKGLHNRHFELTDDAGKTLGKLDYTSWFTLKAEIHLPSGELLTIKNANIWLTAIHVLKNDIELCTLTFNWKGQINISMTDGRNYLLKHHLGFFKSTFTIADENDNDVMALKPDFNLAKLSFSYSIDTDETYPTAKDPVLVLLAIYCANRWQQMHSGAVAAMA